MIYDYTHIYSYNYRLSNLSSSFQIPRKRHFFQHLELRFKIKTQTSILRLLYVCIDEFWHIT